VFGVGGTIRTTSNLATALAERHEVEVFPALRPRGIPVLPVGPAVRVMSLAGTRESHPDFAGDDPRRGRPARVFPHRDVRARECDLPAEEGTAAYLRASDADVVTATRAGLVAPSAVRTRA
jgi:hypothetical protein